MIPISVHSTRLLNKLKNINLVDRSATRVIIDINPEAEWVQLYVCEAGANKADAAVGIIEGLVGKFGKAPGSRKVTKPAKKDETDKKDEDKK